MTALNTLQINTVALLLWGFMRYQEGGTFISRKADIVTGFVFVAIAIVASVIYLI